jgi:hypothetical protein
VLVTGRAAGAKRLGGYWVLDAEAKGAVTIEER